MEVVLGEGKGELRVEMIVNEAKKLPKYGFQGKEGEVLVIPERRRMYIGIGETGAETVRNASALMIRSLQKYQFESLEIATPRIHRRNYLVAFFEGLYLGAYKFDKYKTKKEPHPLKKVIVKSKRDLSEELREGKIKAEAINFVRDIVNSMPDEFTPQKMAETAKELADQLGLEVKIFDEKYLEKNGFGAITAVGRASAHPPRLIHLTYRPKHFSRRIVLIGKGLCYDSGGLSLKPSNHMVTMKLDKAGGATAMGVIKAIAQLGLPVEVHAIIGAVENMIGGNAYKPDDVITAKNGTTIEVRNTDAEGRLVLADCISYAQEEIPNLDRLIDIATLTGACVVGLGEYTAGFMARNPRIIRRFLDSAEEIGEHFAHLPFNRYLPKLLESKVADISNIASSSYGGALTADRCPLFGTLYQ